MVLAKQSTISHLPAYGSPEPADVPAQPRFDNSYARLPERFFAHAVPNPVAAPKLVRLNHPLALELGLDPAWLSGPEGVEMLAGNAFPPRAAPIALAYAGHQFGQFVPQLGDGRALLIGEVIDSSGARRDIQLKGSGRTRFSRGGDGRAPLGPVLREYIVSEAMAALGIPTARTLAAVTTGETVYRQTPQPGAVVARVASSHLRIGTFQYFAARGDVEALKTLADYALARHFRNRIDQNEPYLGLLHAVVSAQAELVARWMLVGFVHGVMNTDNMTISGETIDYGPCAFIDAYRPGAVFSSIDERGRYAYANQPGIAVWNLARLAEALLPLIADGEDEAVAKAESALKLFQPRYEKAFHDGLRRKIGLTEEDDGDLALLNDLFETMARGNADFTRTFRALSDDVEAADGAGATRSGFSDPVEFDAWARRWRQRLLAEHHSPAACRELMRSVNPKYIPRNHRVQAAIAAAEERADFSLFEELLVVLARPFDDQPDMQRYAEPPLDHERVLRTFCGT